MRRSVALTTVLKQPDKTLDSAERFSWRMKRGNCALKRVGELSAALAREMRMDRV
jgi:hypothetical protein